MREREPANERVTEGQSDRKTSRNDCVIYCLIWKQLPLGKADLAQFRKSAVARIVTACLPALPVCVSSNLHIRVYECVTGLMGMHTGGQKTSGDWESEYMWTKDNKAK